jgi:predicted nucleic acid-binding protein
MRSRQELLALQKSLAMRNAVRLPVTESICDHAITLMDSLWFSHKLGMADALIAATALAHGLPLMTGNVKHFSPIAGRIIERFEMAP